MSVGAISAASLSDYILLSSNATQVQQTVQALQNSLESGNLSTATSQFQRLQKLFQSAASAAGSSSSTNTQLSTDLTALGSALSSGDLGSAQSAFTTVQNDLKNSPSPSQIDENNAASQSVQLVQEMLGSLNSAAAPSSTDSMNSLLEQVYGGGSILNVIA
jgi:ribosomal protein S20